MGRAAYADAGIRHTIRMKKRWIVGLWAALLLYGFAWGLSFAVMPVMSAAKGLSSPYVAAAEAEAASQDGALSASMEAVPIVLTIEGRRYVQRVTVSLAARLFAMRHGGWDGCFAWLSDRGVSMRDILNRAAYPLGDGLTNALSRLETPPKAAEVVLTETEPVVTPHRDGYLFPPREVLAAVAACLDGREAKPLVLRYARAAVTTEQLQPTVALIATFSTPYADSPNRVHNLRLACRSLNAVIVPAGAEFSFNRTVGARTEERGYRAAKIISDGAFVEGVGGGVCQVSTTLYNAAMLAGLRQVEVRPHSLAVSYVAPSRDAMVSAWSDMRFANDRATPVYLYASAYQGKVIVRIFGVKEAAVSLSATCRTIAPHRDVDSVGNVIEDTEGYRLVRAGKDAVESTLTRKIGRSSELLRRNTYPAEDAVWQKIEMQPAE